MDGLTHAPSELQNFSAFAIAAPSSVIVMGVAAIYQLYKEAKEQEKWLQANPGWEKWPTDHPSHKKRREDVATRFTVIQERTLLVGLLAIAGTCAAALYDFSR